MPLPKQMTKFVELYTTALIRGYELYGVTAKRVSLFPSAHLRAHGDTQFRTWERAGFTRIGLEHASVWNSRHAVVHKVGLSVRYK